MGETKGYVSQVIGPVVDIHFDNEKEEKIVLPRIHDAMEITRPNGKILIVEVQQHIGETQSVQSLWIRQTDCNEEWKPYHAVRPLPCRSAIR